MDEERRAWSSDATAVDTSGAAVYSMGAVVRMLGIPRRLRTWEDRYYIVVPQRSEGGHRLYSRDQIDQLGFVRDQVEQGTSPSDAFRLLGAKMADHARRQPAGDVSVFIILAERDAHAAEFSEYLLAHRGLRLLRGDRRRQRPRMLPGTKSERVVVDLLISGGAGLGLCEEIKRRGSTPVLAISSLSSRRRRHRQWCRRVPAATVRADPVHLDREETSSGHLPISRRSVPAS